MDTLQTPQQSISKSVDMMKQHSPSVQFAPQSCRPVKVRRWPYIVASILFFFFGIAVTMLALFYNEQTTSASPPILLQSGTTTASAAFEYGPQPQLAQLSFFELTLASFKEQKQSFIEADLSTMKIRYYDKGEITFEAPILTKGKEGSWWETPAGLYSVESTSESHFSSFGKVYTPWNLVFQGNFFIHGWPYYPDGTPVSSVYSGGCIRLSDVDAEKLFRLVNTKTPVLVYEKDYTSDGFSYSVTPPTLDAKAYLVADIESNTILMQSGEKQILPIASVTKLMTALVASEYINLDKDVTIPQSAMATTSITRLTPGMTMSGYSLLLPLLLESSNIAANTYASILGKDRFVQLMNKKAASLGMESTTYTDASGSDSGNVSTLSDLLRLSTYIYNNRSFVYKISSGEKVSTAYNVYPFGTLSNFNPVPGLTGFVGGKVGKTTAAKETIISLYKMNVKGVERTIAFIVLGSNDNYADVQKLYKYTVSQYGATPVVTATITPGS